MEKWGERPWCSVFMAPSYSSSSSSVHPASYTRSPNLRYCACYANGMAFQPMPLSRKPAPFDHPEWVFELKYGGFRSLAVVQNGRCQLISRNGHSFNSFSELRQ